MRRKGGLALALALALPAALVAEPVADLIQISRDPYTNPRSQHATQVEPASFEWTTSSRGSRSIARRPARRPAWP